MNINIFFSAAIIFLLCNYSKSLTMEREEPIELENKIDNPMKRKNPLKKIGSMILGKIKKVENRSGEYIISVCSKEKAKFSASFDTPPTEHRVNIPLSSGDVLELRKGGKQIFSFTFNNEQSDSNIATKIFKS